MDSPQYTSLYATLSALPDPRHARGQRYPWPVLLVLIAAALLAEQKNVRAIADWAALRAGIIVPLLPQPLARIPSRSTFYRVLRVVDITLLEQHLATYAQRLPPPPPPRVPPPVPPVPTPPVGTPAPPTPSGAAPRLHGVALDGKTVRGASAHGVPCQLVSVVRHAHGIVLDQERCAPHEPEPAVVARLLARQDLRHTVVTVDALSTEVALAAQIRRQQGHYLMVVKANQAALLADITLLFAQPPWDVHPTEQEYARYRYTTKGHGRLETRTLERSAALNTYLAWPDVGQVLRRTCERVDLQTGEISVAVSYGITSLPATTVSTRQVERFWRATGRSKTKCITCGMRRCGRIVVKCIRDRRRRC